MQAQYTRGHLQDLHLMQDRHIHLQDLNLTEMVGVNTGNPKKRCQSPPVHGRG